MDRPELSLGEIFVVMVVLVFIVGDGRESDEGEEHQQGRNTFHRRPPRANVTNSSHAGLEGQTGVTRNIFFFMVL